MNKKENLLLMKNGIYLKKRIKNVVVGDSSYYYDKSNDILVKDTVSKAFKSIEETFGNKNRIAYIESSKKNVKCTKESVKHGLEFRNSDENYRRNSFIISNLGIILKNACKINATIPTIKYPKGQDIYLSIISDKNGNSYPTRTIVNKELSLIDDIRCIDQLKSIKGIKKERIPYGIPIYKVGDALSTISLEQLAKEVKYKYSDCLPKILLKKYGVKREQTRLSENTMF